MICMLVSVVDEVVVCMMLVAVLMNRKFVPKLLTAVVVVVRVYAIYEDWNPNVQYHQSISMSEMEQEYGTEDQEI